MIKQVSIGGKEYNITQAPAVDQRKLLTIVASRILLYKNQSGITEINDVLLKGALIGCGDDILQQIETIVLYKTVEHGSGERLTVANFQGSMMAYIELLVEAIKVNLEDFLGWLTRAASEEDGQAN